MSNNAITWAYKQHTKWGAGCKAILVALADMADEAHSCFPGQERLAEMTDQNERTVREHIQRLEDLGFIRREMRHDKNGHRTSDRYYLAVDESFEETDKRRRRPAASATGGLEPSSQPESNDNPYRASGPGNPKREPSVEPSDIPAPQSLTNEMRFEQFWEIYPRKSGKQDAARKYVRALKKVSSDSILTGALRYRDDPNRDDTFTKHPATWLHQGCWDDGPLPQRHPQRGSQTDVQRKVDLRNSPLGFAMNL